MKKSDKQNAEELLAVLLYYNYEIQDNDFKIVCPFHKDVNPSLTVNVEKGIWFCFGCCASGDAYEFVKRMEQKYNHSNELTSLKLFNRIIKNKKLRSQIQITINNKQKKKVDKKDYFQQALDYYYCLPKIDWSDYRLDDEQVEARQYMTNRGFTTDTLNSIGCKFNYNENYKIILPMLDNGIFKGWVCRTTSKEVENKGRKYLYNKGFNRASTLVGNYGKKDYVFMVEGYMDRLKLYQFGIRNSVAILGWKLSKEQIQKLKEKGITKVVCCLDNDTAGKNGYKYCKNFFETYRFQFIKGFKDIGEMKKSQFIKMLNKTKQKYDIKIGG